MTKRETIDILKQSQLWNTLSVQERVDVVAYTLNSIRGDGQDDEELELTDIIGEIYTGN